MTNAMAEPRQTEAAERRFGNADRSALAGPITTQSGLELHVRPAVAGDEAIVSTLFETLSAEDLRHRFLTAIRSVGMSRLRDLIGIDDPRTVSLLVFAESNEQPLAIATLALNADGDECEFAIATRPDCLSNGVSWSLLEHIVRRAGATGIARLSSIETADDVKALQLEREMGFRVSRCPEDPTMMIASKVLGSSDD